MVSDRVGDFIIRLQNAAIVGKKDVSVPYSLYLVAIAKKLKELGFIETVKTDKSSEDIRSSGEKEKVQREFYVTLSFNDNGYPKLRGVKRISKPGQRMYVKSADLHRVQSGMGLAILSTSNGMMTNIEAKKRHLGGELICEVY